MNERGMTLIETIVTLALTSLLCALIFQVYFSFQWQYNSIIAQNEARENLALGLEQISHDVLNSQGVALCLPNQLFLQEGIFYTLRDDPQFKQHLYHQLPDQVLYRRLTGKTNQPMANFVQKMQFYYFDADGQETLQASEVAAVEICLQSKYGSSVMNYRQILFFGAGRNIYG